MRKLFETSGFLIAVLGAAGLFQHYARWAPFGFLLRRVPFDANDILWLNIVLLVVGTLVMITPDLVRATTRR